MQIARAGTPAYSPPPAALVALQAMVPPSALVAFATVRLGAYLVSVTAKVLAGNKELCDFAHVTANCPTIRINACKIGVLYWMADQHKAPLVNQRPAENISRSW